jgi:transposase-like protein
MIELARSGTRVARLSATFGMTERTLYNWLTQDRVDFSK